MIEIDVAFNHEGKNGDVTFHDPGSRRGSSLLINYLFINTISIISDNHRFDIVPLVADLCFKSEVTVITSYSAVNIEASVQVIILIVVKHFILTGIGEIHLISPSNAAHPADVLFCSLYRAPYEARCSEQCENFPYFCRQDFTHNPLHIKHNLP